MPRTVESLVACHQAANALRRAGKPIWTHTIDLQSILDDAKGKESAGDLSVVANRIASEVRRLPKNFLDPSSSDCDFYLLDAVEELEGMTKEGLQAQCNQSKVDASEILNGWLEQIYDWCDQNRVWTRG